VARQQYSRRYLPYSLCIVISRITCCVACDPAVAPRTAADSKLYTPCSAVQRRCGRMNSRLAPGAGVAGWWDAVHTCFPSSNSPSAQLSHQATVSETSTQHSR
jgi:hypothetical protein